MNKRPLPPRIASTELALLQPRADVPALGAAAVLKAFLAGRNERTLRAYKRDLADFAWCVGEPDALSAVAKLLTVPHGHANAVALAYKAHMASRLRPDKPLKDGKVQEGLAAATIARRLAALRSVVAMARTLGVVPWELAVEDPKAEAYRATAGPGSEGWQDMLATAQQDVASGKVGSEAHDRAVRNLAIIRLLHDLALRRGELVALDLADFDQAARTMGVVGKGRPEKKWLTVPESTTAALVAWLDVRGTDPGPLFTRLDRRRLRRPDGPTRLTATSVYRFVVALGEQAGRGKVRPHGLRHEAITAALDRGVNIRTVQRFSRHKHVQTVILYDDNRKDLAGDVAKLVAGDVAELVARDGDPTVEASGPDSAGFAAGFAAAYAAGFAAGYAAAQAAAPSPAPAPEAADAT